MVPQDEHEPQTPAPIAGRYQLLSVMGHPAGPVVEVVAGARLPAAAVGQMWRLVAPRIACSESRSIAGWPPIP